MFYLSHVEIEGFWGKFSASTNFNREVNILIGKNGTGKTTFMDMLQAVLRVDLTLLSTLEFERITIRLHRSSKQRTISVKKESTSERPFDVISYKIGRRTYHLPLSPREIDRYRYQTRPLRSSKGYFEIKHEMDSLINIASLSVHRISYEDILEEDESFRVMRRRSERPIVDRRLDQLSQDLTAYQLTLAEQEKEVSAEFQKDVLTSILYDEIFDTPDLSEIAKTELTQEKRQLASAYKELGASDKNTRNKIDHHFKILNESLSEVRRFLKEQNSTDVEDQQVLTMKSLMSLPLLERTQHIIDLSLQAEKKKQKISEPIRKFLKIAGNFMIDKELKINPSTGTLNVIKDEKPIPLLDLSSGEKQLLILLIETLLQKNEPFIFLADEPEISLHIEWQEKVISTIRKLNVSSQIIVATHSPEIAGGWKDFIINMEDIISV